MFPVVTLKKSSTATRTWPIPQLRFLVRCRIRLEIASDFEDPYYLFCIRIFSFQTYILYRIWRKTHHTRQTYESSYSNRIRNYPEQERRGSRKATKEISSRRLHP